MQQPYRAAANLFRGAARGGAPGNVFADVAADFFAIHFMVHTDLMAGCHIGGLILGDCADLGRVEIPSISYTHWYIHLQLNFTDTADVVQR